MEEDKILEAFKLEVLGNADFDFGEDYLDDFKLVSNDDWVGNGKYQHASCVYRHVESNRYFRVNMSRTGSYYSDYDYQDPTIQEVWPKTVVSVAYTNKKPD